MFFFKTELKDKGFTIIELVIVMAMISILTAIAFPVFNSWLPREKLKSGARDLVSAIETLKSRAIENNEIMTMVFSDSSSPGNYFYFIDKPDTSGKYGTYETLSESLDFNFPFINYENSGIDFGAGNASKDWNGNTIASSITFQNKSLTFDPKGFSIDEDRNPADGIVFIKNKNNDICYAISVSAVGTVKLREFNGKW